MLFFTFWQKIKKGKYIYFGKILFHFFNFYYLEISARIFLAFVFKKMKNTSEESKKRKRKSGWLCCHITLYNRWFLHIAADKATMWVEWENPPQEPQQPEPDSHLDFDFLSLLSKPKDYYKILEVDFDATDDAIRSNYIRLALKWHPDKQKDNGNSATSRFQEINEAYQILSDPVKRREYDTRGMLHVYDYDIIEYLKRYKGLILTCNGLGIRQSIW
ncbi:Chaperone DnaJ-domain superfamily protein [Theobroma cacao]|uniref:Chaperone DnaJ-domain superfamily protein n=1 Tax=Theobroma cacao TaxID=3641 RepID=A0A061FDK6_THECC|nr:Chaperone DnaJ-domain superfamily protein [Theobroma cacao]